MMLKYEFNCKSTKLQFIQNKEIFTQFKKKKKCEILKKVHP